MSGESDLKSLLRDMKPEIIPGEYVFCSIQENQLGALENPLLVFRESEGSTVIVTKVVAEDNELDFNSSWGLVTLSIHSDLEAVGFLAAITGHLAEAGISVNAVSAFYHDHLFVPFERVDEVVSLLLDLTDSSRVK
ncbi:MAG: ACT domain-containing protein [Candidatus Thorarchaeota archaeon]|nr:ACT domain-containing protein [Candidatus Thorarchaeota archaeon]